MVAFKTLNLEVKVQILSDYQNGVFSLFGKTPLCE